MTTYLLEHALLPDGIADNVVVTVEDGVFSQLGSRHASPGGSSVVPEEVAQRPSRRARSPVVVSGLTIPGLANCHSHAFHRALRGRTQRERGSFWTWREQMYAVAARLDPDSYRQLASAVFKEMVACGYTSVGEFHYLHHQPDGTPYDDPNAMGHALLDAAREAGIRIRLLDTCYLSSGFGESPQGVQVRYSDGDAETWAERVGRLPEEWRGAAIHSVRAVPEEHLDVVIEASKNLPLHVHLSEQVAENEACVAATGRTPTRLLHDHGAWSPRSSAVHATHLTETDIALLGGDQVHACFCPTTERDLGDGIGPSRELHEAGARLTIGSDSHAVLDPFEEMRAVELDERLASQQRGHWSAGELINAATRIGHASLGFDDVGQIAVGQRADLVTLDLDSLRLAGQPPSAEQVVFAATSADVTQVMVDGIVQYDGSADARRDIARQLHQTIGALLDD